MIVRNPFIGKIDNIVKPWTDNTVYPSPTSINTYISRTQPSTSKNLFSSPIVECGSKYHHVVLILDESSSMESTKSKTINTVNEFLQSIRDSEIDTYVSIVTFNGSSFKWIKNKDSVKKIEGITSKDYNPNGMTNLTDTIGNVLETINSSMFLEKQNERGAVSIFIVTDGEENSSRYYNKNDIKEMSSKLESNGYAFRFFGADIDAFSEGASYGVNINSTMSLNKSKIDNLGDVMSNYVATRGMLLNKGDTMVASASALYETTHGSSDREKLK